jgi:HlyD family secretion protein
MTERSIRPVGWQMPALAFIVIAVIAVLGFSRAEDSVSVATARATYQDLSEQITTNGTVTPTSEFQARAFWPGIIDTVNVELGQKVEPGQLLVSMKDPFAISRVTAANAALQGWRLSVENIRNGGSQFDRIDLHGNLAHAQLAQADAAKTLAAIQQLQQEGAASQAEVDAAAEKLKSANATLQTLQQKDTNPYSASDLKNATSHLADAQANVDSAKVQFNNANIASPMSGTVYSISVVPYDWVPVGADLIRVADLNHVEIRAFFDEPEIGKLHSGQPVSIVWDGRQDRTWHGHIKQAPIAATALGTRSVGECIIAVDDSKEDLLPNTNVIVTVTIQQHLHALSIPRTALQMDNGSPYVFRVEDGKLIKTSVQTGIVNLDRAEIVQGLTENEVVAVNAEDNSPLRDGLNVRVVK